VLYRIKESYELATGQLSDNAYAWNKQGHVLYVDQPKGVGNSFGANTCPSSVEAERTQFFIAFNSPGSTHTAESRWHFRIVD
jgi:carboxypeptidase C (cathepsin A)